MRHALLLSLLLVVGPLDVRADEVDAAMADLGHADLQRRARALSVLDRAVDRSRDEAGRDQLAKRSQGALGRLLEVEPEPALRMMACDLAMRMACPDSPGLARGLEACLARAHGPIVRQTASFGLVQLGAAGAPAIVRCALLPLDPAHPDDDPSRVVRERLGQPNYFAEARRAAVPLLDEATAPARPEQDRLGATRALTACRRGAAGDDELERRIVERLIDLVTADEARAVRAAAAEGLEVLGPRGEAAAPRLVAGLAHADDEVVGWLQQAVAGVGQAAIAAVTSGLAVQDPVVARRTVATLRIMAVERGREGALRGAIEPPMDVGLAGEPLGRLLASPDLTLRREVASVLLLVVHDAVSAGPALVAALGAEDEDQQVRADCARALGRLRPPSAQAIAALREAARRAPSAVGDAAEGALRALGVEKER